MAGAMCSRPWSFFFSLKNPNQFLPFQWLSQWVLLVGGVRLGVLVCFSGVLVVLVDF